MEVGDGRIREGTKEVGGLGDISTGSGFLPGILLGMANGGNFGFRVGICGDLWSEEFSAKGGAERREGDIEGDSNGNLVGTLLAVSMGLG